MKLALTEKLAAIRAKSQSEEPENADNAKQFKVATTEAKPVASALEGKATPTESSTAAQPDVPDAEQESDAKLTPADKLRAKLAAAKAKSGGVKIKKQTAGATPTKAVSQEQALATVTEESSNSSAPEDWTTYFPEAVYNIEGLDCANLCQALQAVEGALDTHHPDLKNYLALIHKNARQYEELSYLLTDDQLHVYISGMLKLSNTAIDAKPKKKANKSKTEINKLNSMDDAAAIDMFM